MVDVTLKQGVEVMITEGVPGVSEVVDATDHAAGTDPFY
jgi:Fe/S biogenesis protein NfuA